MDYKEGWFSKLNKDAGEDEMQVEVSKLPIELEKIIDTLDKPLILECACPGWQQRNWPAKKAYPWGLPPGYNEGGVRYPAIPCEIEDQANEIIQATNAGCAVAHVHPRDPEDCVRTHDPSFLAKVYDLVFESVDVISLQHTWKITKDGKCDYVTPAEELLSRGNGNRYCQGAVVLWPPANSYPKLYTKAVQDGVRFMEANKIKPIHKLRSSYHVRQLQRTLIDTKVIKEEPFILVHDMGHPFGWPLDIDPWMPIDLITSIEQTKRRIPGGIIGVFSGGRNWMPITMTAILAGVDFVRVGIEDVYWMYPHQNEVIQHNIDCIQKVIDFCKLIGRRIATVEQTRAIMGMTRSS